jgi:hypothetical protein
MKSAKHSKHKEEVYDSLDAPVFYWIKVHESGDLSWLLVKRKKLNKSLLKILVSAWENVYDQFLKEFGFSDGFEAILRKKIEIALMKCELIMTGDRSLETFIEIALEELKDLQVTMGKGNCMEAKIAIERHFKFQINLMTTSIREFYSYLNHIK